MEYRFSGLTTPTDWTTLYSVRDGAAGDYLSIHSDGTLDWNGFTTTSTHTELFDGGIHSVAMAIDLAGGGLNFYVDGAFVEAVATPAYGGPATGNATFILGQYQGTELANFDPDRAFSGTFHDVRIWDDIRSTTEIADFHDHKFDSGDIPANLIVNWQMTELTGASSNQVADIVNPAANVTLEVRHVAEAGFSSSTASTSLSIDENSANGTSVGFVVPTDADAVAGEFAFGLTDASGRFTIDSSTGEITVADGTQLNAENFGSHTILVSVTDGSGGLHEESLTIFVDDMNEAPTATVGSPLEFVRGSTGNVWTPSSLTFTDPDSSDTSDQLTYQITGAASYGTLRLNGTALDVGDEFTVEDVENGFVTYDHDGSSSLNDSVALTLRDGGEDGVAAQVATLIIKGANSAPTANADSYSISQDTALSTHGDWWNTSWQFRRELTFDNTSSTTNLMDQTVLVTLNSSNIDYSNTQDGGEDLRFIDGDGTELNYEIESWDETGVSQVWVEVPQIDSGSSTDSILMYYGNTGASAGASTMATWGSRYDMVQHMSTAGYESTSGSVVGSSNTADANGIVAGAQSFNGTDSQIDLGADASLDNVFDGGGTVSVWFNASSWGENGRGRLMDKATGVTPSPDGWSIATEGSGADGRLTFEFGFSGDYGRWRMTSADLNLNQWHHVVVSYDSSDPGNSPVFYVDGSAVGVSVQQAASGTAISDAGQNLAIGNELTGTDRTFDGLIDEVRIEDGITTQDRVQADTQSVTGSFVSFGEEQTAANAGVAENDTDPDGDALTVSLLTGPNHAQSFSLNADGSFDYTPTVGFLGTDSFQYEISDGVGVSTATATIMVNDANVAPVLNDTAAYTLLDVATGTTNPIGTTIDDLVASGGANSITDADSGDSQGIVVTNVDDSNGTWEFTTNGIDWTAFSSAGGSGSSNVNVLLEGSDRIRFIPNSGYDGSAGSVTFRAWDQTTGTAGDADVDLSTVGGQTAFSSEEASATLDVRSGGEFTISIPSTQLTEIDTPITFRVADGNVVTFDDGISDFGIVRLELTSANGTISIANTFGVVFSEGTTNNSSHIVLYSIQSEIAQALEDVTFTPSSGFAGTAEIDVDLSWSGEGGNYGFEDGTAADSSPEGIDGTMDPTMAIVDAERGNVAQFDGTQSVDIPTNFSQTRNFTLSTWVNFDDTSFDQEFVSVGGGGVRLALTSSGGITAFFENNDGLTYELASGITPPAGEWHHVAFRFDDMDQRLYVDGVEVASSAVGGEMVPNANSTTLGQSDTNPTLGFEGMLDDFKVYDPALSRSRVVSLFNGTESAGGVVQVEVAAAPTAVDDGASISEGGMTTIDLTGNDLETFTTIDDASVVVTSGPGNGSLVVLANGTVEYTHNGGETTTDQFSYTVQDADGRTSNVATVSITISNVNDVPVAADDSIVVGEGQTFVQTTSVFGNDSDPDGPSATGTVVTGPSHGALTFNSDGTFEYDHDGSETIADSFVYEINDGDGGTSQATVSIMITSSNDAPVAVGDSFVVNEGQTHIQTASVFNNDSDSDGPSATGAIVSGPAHGTLTWNTDGTFEYAHGGGEATTDQFTYEINDGAGGTDQATVSITIMPENDVPVAVDDSAAVDEGATLVQSVSVFNNDADPDGPAATGTVVDGPEHGTLTWNADGTYVYEHDGSETIADSFVYEINDGDGGSDQATVFLTINPVNDAPIANNDQKFATSAVPMTIEKTELLSNDTDAESDATNIAVVNQPLNGSVSITADGDVVYTADNGFSGSDTFTYSISDGVDTSDPATVSVTVVLAAPPPQAPPSETSNESESESESSAEGEEAVISDSSFESTGGDDTGPGGGPDDEDDDRVLGALPQSSVQDESLVVQRSLSNPITVDTTSSDLVIQQLGLIGQRVIDAGTPTTVMVDMAAELLKSNVPLSQSVVGSQMTQAMEDLERELDAELMGSQVVIGSLVTSSASLSVGIVYWAIRAGYLAAGVLTSTPAWKVLDPSSLASILDGDDPDESIENLLEGA